MKIWWNLLLMIGLMACRQEPAELTEMIDPGVSRELAQFRKSTYWDVKYNLSFVIPENKQEAVTGMAEIAWKQGRKEPLIVDFRADSSQIMSVALNDKPVAYRFENEHIVISHAETWGGENKVKIAFRAADQSLNRRDEFLYTLLVPDRARTLFPCFDQPDIKALYSLTLDIPADWTAVANGKIQEEDVLSRPNRRLIRFQETEPLPTYLFSFVAGKLQREIYQRGERSISIYHRETDPKRVAQCPEIAGQVLDALAWMEDYTGIPYPFAKYDLIIIPGFQFGGMEHTGATLYNDGSMFLNEQPTLDEQLRRSSLIAHETAHMWFGDYVTMAWFDDVWTKEVFANYFAVQITEPLFPEVNHRLNFMRGYIPASYAEDRTEGATPVKQSLDNLRNAGLIYSNIVYDKSPVVMEMLIRRMEKEAYRKGLHDYLDTYRYGNATWEQLIEILNKYSKKELARWSDVWIKEKGMPIITARIEGDSLLVQEQDPLDRGRVWPQVLRYRICSADKIEDVEIEIGDSIGRAAVPLTRRFDDGVAILPNIEGCGYGFFRMNPDDVRAAFACLDSTKDDLLKGSLLISLQENLQHKTLDADTYLHGMMDYLAKEPNDLLYSMALGYVGSAVRFAQDDLLWLEKALWQQVTAGRKTQFRIQAFRQYQSVADSKEAVSRLYKIWKGQQAPGGCVLSERDYINLSYLLALHLPEQADEIVATQLNRITNPDRQAEYRFISPAVSADRTVRDSVFQSLLKAENRRVEPWVSSSLSLLNHRLREQESLPYIRPALMVLPEVQRTGDIFFPSAWLRALLGGHTSPEALQEVDCFRQEEMPQWSPLLQSKFLQQAHHLYVVNEASEMKLGKPCQL